MFLQNERDRMQRVHIGKTFSAHRMIRLFDFRRIVAVQLHLDCSIVVDVHKDVRCARGVDRVDVVQIVPEIPPVPMLSHAPCKRGLLQLQRHAA